MRKVYSLNLQTKSSIVSPKGDTYSPILEAGKTIQGTFEILFNSFSHSNNDGRGSAAVGGKSGGRDDAVESEINQSQKRGVILL